MDATSYHFREATAPIYRRPGRIVAVNGRPVAARPARDPIATTGRDDDAPEGDDLVEGEDLEDDDLDADDEGDDDAPEAAAAPEGGPKVGRRVAASREAP